MHVDVAFRNSIVCQVFEIRGRMGVDPEMCPEVVGSHTRPEIWCFCSVSAGKCW